MDNKSQPAGPIVQAAIVAVGSLVGAFFASLFLPLDIRPPAESEAAYLMLRNVMILAVGVILGGLLFSWAKNR